MSGKKLCVDLVKNLMPQYFLAGRQKFTFLRQLVGQPLLRQKQQTKFVKQISMITHILKVYVIVGDKLIQSQWNFPRGNFTMVLLSSDKQTSWYANAFVSLYICS